MVLESTEQKYFLHCHTHKNAHTVFETADHCPRVARTKS